MDHSPRTLRNLLLLGHHRALARSTADKKGLAAIAISQSALHAIASCPRNRALTSFLQWLAPKRGKPQNNSAYYNQQNVHGMQNYPEPPPVYNPGGMPPAYQPPPDGSKVAPQQSGVVGGSQTPSQGAPQLPPPVL
jgi:hypothetical protein